MKNRILTIATLLGSFLLAFSIAEIGLRVAGVEYPIFRQSDPVTGVSYIPDASGWQTSEGRAYISINREGFRDRDHEIHKPPGTLRIAVLGDSFTAAVQVSLESTYWSVLERELAKLVADRYPDVEVMAFGVGGYGTAQQYLLLQNQVWKYSPDIVVLAVCTGNDLRDNLRALSGKSYVPYFHYVGEHLVLDDRFLESEGYLIRQSWSSRAVVRLSRYSRLVQLANQARLSLARRRTRQRITQTTERELIDEFGLGTELYIPPESELLEEAWKVTEGILVRMYEEVYQHNARFMIVTLSNGIQVHPNSQRREELQIALGVEDLFYPERRIASLADERAMDVLNLAPFLQRYADETGYYLHGFEGHLGGGHWNEKGHRLAGEIMATRIVENLHGSQEE